MPAQLAHKSASDPQGAKCTCNRRVRIVLDPVQDGIGKNSVEFVLKNQLVGVHYSRVQAAPKSGRNHVWRTVDTNHLRAKSNQLFSQCAVAATQIEDALTLLGLK